MTCTIGSALYIQAEREIERDEVVGCVIRGVGRRDKLDGVLIALGRILVTSLDWGAIKKPFSFTTNSVFGFPFVAHQPITRPPPELRGQPAPFPLIAGRNGKHLPGRSGPALFPRRSDCPRTCRAARPYQ
jgi:hypothetical protein